MGTPVSLSACGISKGEKELAKSQVVKFALSLVIGGFIVANLFLAPRAERLFFTDAEFRTAHQIQTERAQWYIQWGLMWLPDKVGAIHFLCVAEDSIHFRLLQSPWNIRGTRVISDCEPLDFTDRLADQLHPNLITEDVRRSGTYYAYDPDYTPEGDWAVMVRARYDDYVLVHIDTLRHLRLADIRVDE